MSKAQFFKCHHTTLPCDTYGCSSRAAWFIGRTDGPLSVTWKVCQACAENIFHTAPNEIVGAPEEPIEENENHNKTIYEDIDSDDTNDPSMLTNEEQTEVECIQCGRMFGSGRALNIHIAQAHRDEE